MYQVTPIAVVSNCVIFAEETGEKPNSGTPVRALFAALCLDNGGKPSTLPNATMFVRLCNSIEESDRATLCMIWFANGYQARMADKEGPTMRYGSFGREQVKPRETIPVCHHVV